MLNLVDIRCHSVPLLASNNAEDLLYLFGLGVGFLFHVPDYLIVLLDSRTFIIF